MPWYYVMTLGVTYSFYFGLCANLLKDHMVQNHAKCQQPRVFGSRDIGLPICLDFFLK